MKKENKLNNFLDNDLKIDLRLSYSKVSDFDRNGAVALIRPSNVNNEGTKHGSIVDVLLVDKLTGTNNIDKLYCIIEENKPTVTLGILCDIILDNYTKLPNTEEVLNIIKRNNFWARTKEDSKMLLNFNNDLFWNYLKMKFDTKDKIVISQEDFNKAQNNVELLLNHKFTHNLFKNHSGIEHYYQIEFNIEYKNFNFKGFLDKMTIDRINKKVYFEDIKTGEGSNDKFIESFIKYRYYFQEAIYMKAFDYLSKLYDFENYELTPFKFIYLSKTGSHPLVFKVSETWHNAALKGFTTISGYKYRGLDECLDDIYYHWKNKQYEFTKEIHENNGIVILKDDFIRVNE